MMARFTPRFMSAGTFLGFITRVLRFELALTLLLRPGGIGLEIADEVEHRLCRRRDLVDDVVAHPRELVVRQRLGLWQD